MSHAPSINPQIDDTHSPLGGSAGTFLASGHYGSAAKSIWLLMTGLMASSAYMLGIAVFEIMGMSRGEFGGRLTPLSFILLVYMISLGYLCILALIDRVPLRRTQSTG